jgi:formiminotetrahydrofolate cyclodeaminase
MDPSRLNDLPAPELIERMATGDPIPGGGSAAALAGAMGAGLLRMVVALTSGRPAAAEDEKELAEIAIGAATCQSELLNLVELDAVAYDGVIRARRLPRETDIERQARAVQVAAATREATRAPLQTARLAERVLKLAERLAPIGSRNAISDAGVGALLAVAALRGAVLNVQINLPYLDADDAMRTIAADEVERLLNGLDDREHAIREQVEGQLG